MHFFHKIIKIHHVSDINLAMVIASYEGCHSMPKCNIYTRKNTSRLMNILHSDKITMKHRRHKMLFSNHQAYQKIVESTTSDYNCKNREIHSWIYFYFLFFVVLVFTIRNYNDQNINNYWPQSIWNSTI